MTWLAWQLVDSAFPTGGFAHSGGLEAAVQQGEVTTSGELQHFIDAAIWQAGYASMPLANAAFDEPVRLDRLDALCDAFTTSHVANRASRVQGRVFASTCTRVFGLPSPAVGESYHHHFAPAFGTCLRLLDVPRADMQRVLLHLTLRGIASAAIRLGIVGPFEAQRIQAGLAPLLERVIGTCACLTEDDLAQAAPHLDILQAAHDRLYSRLFQS